MIYDIDIISGYSINVVGDKTNMRKLQIPISTAAQLNFNLKDVDGVAINITGYAFRLTAKQLTSDASSIFDLTGSIITAADGHVRFTMGNITTEYSNLILEFVWWTSSDTTQTPNGRSQMLLDLIAKVR